MDRRRACVLIAAGVAAWTPTASALAGRALAGRALAGRALAGRRREFSNPERVEIRDYAGDAMEPFVTRDGRYLIFNNRNDPSVDTNLFYAERVDDRTFAYRGEVAGANSTALDAVATADRANVFYFVSTRSYDQTASTIYRGTFDQGRVTGVALVPGVSRAQPGMVNFDVEVSASGETLYYVESRFGASGPETADLAIARRSGDGFSRASESDALLKHVNTDGLEYAACVSNDERTLFFTRLAKGASAPSIFTARRASTRKPFRAPERVDAADGFVEGPALSPDERSLYYHKRDGDRFVIYRVTRA